MQKKYSLALGWWAARWLTHIWVLKYLQEQKIEISEISWTSMWAIVWSLFAIWKSIDEIIDFAKSINYFKLADFSFSLWLLKWDKVYKKLEEVFWNKKIENQKIKLKIITTNIITWKKKVFEKWKIVDALRASFSLPWIFVPFKINWEKYVDWWIINNLPIESLKWKNIIAVSALKNVNWPILTKRKIFWLSFKRQFLNLSYQIIHRTILLMMKQNEIRSIESKNKNILLIQPNFWELDYYSFNKVGEFVELGYKEIKKKIKKDA